MDVSYVRMQESVLQVSDTVVKQIVTMLEGLLKKWQTTDAASKLTQALPLMQTVTAMTVRRLATILFYIATRAAAWQEHAHCNLVFICPCDEACAPRVCVCAVCCMR